MTPTVFNKNNNFFQKKLFNFLGQGLIGHLPQIILSILVTFELKHAESDVYRRQILTSKVGKI